MIAHVVDDTHCGACGSRLRKSRTGGLECQCSNGGGWSGIAPQYGGLLDLQDHGTGVARCTRCGWAGVPIYDGGLASTHCPSCEGADTTGIDLRSLVVAHGEVLMRVTRAGIRRYGRWARRSAPKVSRNAPCPCGSGLKFKKCCGR